MSDVLLPLFAYGTLRDPDYQRELFGRVFEMRPARVRDYVVVSTGGGYLAAVARPGSAIDGALVQLDAEAYAIADAWEDLDVYARVITTAHDRDGAEYRCCIYVGRATDGAAVADGRITDRSRSEVIGDIRSFRASEAFKRRR